MSSLPDNFRFVVISEIRYHDRACLVIHARFLMQGIPFLDDFQCLMSNQP
jgi:hypothetical protein